MCFLLITSYSLLFSYFRFSCVCRMETVKKHRNLQFFLSQFSKKNMQRKLYMEAKRQKTKIKKHILDRTLNLYYQD